MKPGTELDKLVCAKIGIEPLSKSVYLYTYGNFRVNEYPTLSSFDDCGLVIEWLRKHDRFIGFFPSEKGWYASYTDREDERQVHAPEGETLQHAACLTALEI